MYCAAYCRVRHKLPLTSGALKAKGLSKRRAVRTQGELLCLSHNHLSSPALPSSCLALRPSWLAFLVLPVWLFLLLCSGSQ